MADAIPVTTTEDATQVEQTTPEVTPQEAPKGKGKGKSKTAPAQDTDKEDAQVEQKDTDKEAPMRIPALNAGGDFKVKGGAHIGTHDAIREDH